MAKKDKGAKSQGGLAWEGDIPITGRYTAGIAGEKFFRAIKDEGRFLGTRCPACDLVYLPAVMFCERCFAELEEWVELPNQGDVFTYTVLHRSLDDEPLETPQILAFIKLEGADGGLIHKLEGIEPDEVEVGLAVEAVFKPAADREGSILDILHFKPAA
jgi:uncharacterized OB-fold protein